MVKGCAFCANASAGKKASRHKKVLFIYNDRKDT
jgi:hypothetical protein